MCLDYNLQYRPVSADRVRREIQSAQTVIELLLLMAAEKEAEQPARSGDFYSTFTVDGQERKVKRTPDGRFAATKKAVGDAAAAVGKAAGSAGKAVGDAAKGLLETDADKIRQQGAAAFDTGNWEDLDYFGKKQIKKHPELSPKLEGIAVNLQFEMAKYMFGDKQAEGKIQEYFNEMADVIADSMEGDAGMIDKVKKGIKELPQNIKKTVSDTAKSLQENSSKTIADAEAAFVMADKTTKEAIGNAQKSALDTLEKSKKGILDKAGATGKAASDAFSSVLKAASSAGDGVKKKVDAAKEKGKEIMASVDPNVVKNVGTAVSLAAGAATFGGIAGSAAVLAIGGGAIAGIGVAALTGLLGIAPAAGAMAAVAADWGTLIAVTVAIDKNLFTQSDKAEKAVKSAFDDLAASIEKAKTEQEAKKKETKEVSAAAMDYFSYILGYK